MQKADIDVATAVALIQGFIEWLRAFRVNGFQQYSDDANKVVHQRNEDQLGIASRFRSTRVKRRRTEFDEIMENPQKKFKAEVFNVMMDTFVSQVKERFTQIENYF